MRIAVWNCAMRLRGEKLRALEKLQADLAVVPACESPQKLWGREPLLAPIPMEWVGDNESNGLGVLAFNGFRVKRHSDYDPSLRWLLPVEVRGPVAFRLLAVWAPQRRLPHGADDELSGQFLGAIKYYRPFLKVGNAVVAGDFNSNSPWRPDRQQSSHARTIAGLERMGMASAYHIGRGELHGKETVATRYRRNGKSDGAKHHADYCFLPLEWCSHLREVDVGTFSAWVGSGLSDHVPLVVDVDVEPRKDRPHAKSPRSDLHD